MTVSERFLTMGEPLLAGLYENTDRGLFYRKALGLRRYYEAMPAPAYQPGRLYPSGARPSSGTVDPNYMGGYWYDINRLREKDREMADLFASSEFFRYHSSVPKEHTVAGDMWTHSMPDTQRILAEGFDSYDARIEKIEDGDLRDGLAHLLAGIRNYHARCLEYLESVHAEPRLIEALKVVPFKPCRTLYQAIVGWNFVLYLDGCDNLGSLAQGLMPYDRGEDVEALIRNLYENLDENGGYSMQLGLVETRLTEVCLRAAHGLRRPMIELFIDENTSDSVWQAALDCIRSGGGSPALYNKKLYLEGFKRRFPLIRAEDLERMCGGGCTEMMISGLSNVGSLDAGINLALILDQTMPALLKHADTFDAFYEGYLSAVHEAAVRVMDGIAQSQRDRIALCPVPMRTLLIGDCIDKGLEYNAGGARYLWSIVNFAGMINVIDSLLVIRDRYYGDEKRDAAAFLAALNDEDFRRAAKNHPHRFGIGDPDADALSHRFSHEIFGYLDEQTTAVGWGFLPSAIQFQSYGGAGAHVGATPDGRACGSPLCDSLTAIFGKDTEGPTALLQSVAALDLRNALGTPVVNFTIQPQFSDAVIRGLMTAYMAMGGMQIQITCISRETLEEAYRDPESHRNLVVRVGGYSEYFYRLSDDLKLKVLERTFQS